jgi:hypothetical protein
VVRTRLIILAVVLAGALGLVPASQAGHAATLALDVNFDYAGNITVTLPDGSPVGTASGTPTVIPAGYYIVTLTQPGCVDVPAFILQGPGVNIQDDLQSGEIVSDGDAADFQPSSTYTWRDGSINPPVNYTFQTSAQVVGTPPAPTAPTPIVTGSNKAESNADPVGTQGSSTSTGTTKRGTLTGAVTAAGLPALSFEGKTVTHLSAGQYTLALSSRSLKLGLVIGNASHQMVIARGASSNTKSVSTKSVSIDLTSGRWYLSTSTQGRRSYFSVAA